MKDEAKAQAATVRARASQRLKATSRWRLLALVLATVLLVAAAFFLWQAWLIHGESGTRQTVVRAQARALQGIEQSLHARRMQIDEVLADAAIQAALASGTESGRQLARTRARLMWPDWGQIEFYAADMDRVVHADYRHFGYAKGGQLVRMLDPAARPQVGVVLRSKGTALSMARRVFDHQGHLLGYAWFEWPLASLQASLDATRPGGARITLRNGSGLNGLVLLSHGQGQTLFNEIPSRQVPGSVLWVGGDMPIAPIVMPRHWLLALVLAIVALACSALLLKPRLLRRRRAVPEDEEFAVSEEVVPAKSAQRVSVSGDKAGAPGAAKPAVAATPLSVDANIFRAYDIRGVVGKQLTVEVAHALGQAIGDLMREKGLGRMVVGRDGRLSGPELVGGLSDGLRSVGIDVVDVGAVPTPLVYFATYHLQTGSGVAVTGSHNPPDYNGFKIVVGGETLSEDAIQDLYRRIQAGPEPAGHKGDYEQVDVIEDYLERVATDVQAERPLKVVADAGNGIAGELAPRLLEAIGCEVVPLFCEVDGKFPNHHPDPSDPHNLEDLIQAVEATGADLGVAFDGDGDRLGVVTREGEIIYPDRLLMLFARDVLSRVPGATVIYDVKCTGHLGPEVLKAGGSPLMWRTGHSLIKSKMRETEAQLAGEMSGHFFFRERWYGFDDGLYSATRLLEILAGDLEGRSVDEIFATLPKGVSTPELKIQMSEGRNHPFIARFQRQARFEDARLTTIDGVRADWPDGWGLVRASNTTPVLVLRFDANSEAALDRIKQLFREQLLALDPELTMPF